MTPGSSQIRVVTRLDQSVYTTASTRSYGAAGVKGALRKTGPISTRSGSSDRSSELQSATNV